MYVLTWLLRIVLFLLLVSFAAKNADPVTISYYLDQEIQLPINVVILIVFALGAVIGCLSCYRKKPKQKNCSE